MRSGIVSRDARKIDGSEHGRFEGAGLQVRVEGAEAFGLVVEGEGLGELALEVQVAGGEGEDGV